MRGYRQKKNARTSLKRRVRKGDSMVDYDQLPAELRSWLMHAALPWSPRSVLKSWQKSLQANNGNAEAAKQNLTHIERKILKRDKFHIPIEDP
ncbi:hypothetical protein EDD53_0909 [Pacificibacter maritimus]|uniref:Uncharacterized protein n=1 Tax=Pacificibacter maritimus TaxID=762213 RepID=A0A3N4UW67_9RHOB|nr:DUF6525 family protein [Pacificibacter maritimus]RPE71781.1 hypothetical protein EDD53_0909 [Pacificibacter maritimus]